MAYRLHVTIHDATGERLSLPRLEREVAGLVKPAGLGGPIGHAGTRYGAPGIWIERDRSYYRTGPEAIRSAVTFVRRFGIETGYTFRYYATNGATAKAVGDIVTIERG